MVKYRGGGGGGGGGGEGGGGMDDFNINNYINVYCVMPISLDVTAYS